MGYSKHELSSTNMLYSLKKIVILHPNLPITATSPLRLLSSVPKVAIVERFDCMKKREGLPPNTTTPPPTLHTLTFSGSFLGQENLNKTASFNWSLI